MTVISCKRCGREIAPLAVNQRHCPPCAVEWLRILAEDERRRAPRFSVGKSFDRWSPA